MPKTSSIELLKTSHIVFVDANRLQRAIGPVSMTWMELSVEVDQRLRVSTYCHKTRVRDVLARRYGIADPREA